MKILDQFINDKILLERFLKDCKCYAVKKQTYDTSYPEFLKYFDSIEEITLHNLVIGINFTYGWMPTIFDFRSQNFEPALKSLNEAKKGIIPSSEELELLKGLFNNSLVGTS